MEAKLTLKLITEAYYKQASTSGPPSWVFHPLLLDDCDSVEWLFHSSTVDLKKFSVLDPDWLIFYFQTSLWYFKSFYEGLKGLYKTLEAPQGVKINI